MEPTEWKLLPLTAEEGEFILLMTVFGIRHRTTTHFLFENGADPSHALSDRIVDCTVCRDRLVIFVLVIQIHIASGPEKTGFIIGQVVDTLIYLP